MLAAILAAWLQYGVAGTPVARAVVDGAACPTLTVDGTLTGMRVRAAADPPRWAVTTCEAPVAPVARSVRVNERALPPPPRAVRTVVVVGDTGCRIKGAVAQACDDPARWPFPRVAADAARERPDLVVHVGDYLYRESACPAAEPGCAGSPHGDDWPTWAADFAVPAAPLAAAAPVVLVRGNHENCDRAGSGWFRLYDPGPSRTCAPETPPYGVALDGLRLVVLDDGDAEDASAPDRLVGIYREELARARALAAPGAWLLAHRPPYANATLRAAAGKDGFAPFAALVSGHIHTFAALDLAGEPPLFIDGMGGDRLDAGFPVQTAVGFLGGTVRGAVVDARFGYAVYRKRDDGWDVEQHAVDGSVVRRCALRSGGTRCG